MNRKIISHAECVDEQKPLIHNTYTRLNREHYQFHQIKILKAIEIEIEKERASRKRERHRIHTKDFQANS